MIIGHAPKNYKRGKFIMGRFTLLQLLTFLGCCAFSLFGCVIFSIYAKSGPLETRILVLCLLILPAVIGYIATFSMGIYHNMANFFIIWIRYLKKEKKYSWEGIYQIEPKEYEK